MVREGRGYDSLCTVSFEKLERKAKHLNIYIIAISALLTFLPTFPCAADIPAPSKDYRNFDYEFSVQIPSDLTGCVSEVTNHGVAIYLDHRSGCEGEDRPYVGIFANYNVATDAITPAGLARRDCRDRDAKHVVSLKSWTLGGRRAAGCRQYFGDGRITVEITTMRKTEPDNPEIWIDISAYLLTTVARYQRDMRQFRKIVRTIRIAPDGPLK